MMMSRSRPTSSMQITRVHPPQLLARPALPAQPSHLPTRSGTSTWLSAFWIAMLMLGVIGDIPTAKAGGPPGNFGAEYIACDEYAGVGLVPLANVITRVPDDYIVLEPVPGFALVVAQSGSCEEIRVDGAWGQPGIFAQFGVGIVPPLAPGNGDFYQLLFTTNHPKLAAKLKKLGVKARNTPQLTYEINGEPALTIDVPKPPKLAFTLSGPITLPDPLTPPNPLTVFNYYVQTKSYGNVLQQNVVEGIRFGEGSGVTLTAIGSDMQAIVGEDILMFPFFSKPESFDHAEVSVIADVF